MALELVGRYALLGVAHQRDGRKPLAQGQMGVVKQGTGQRAELKPAGGALKQPTRSPRLVLRFDRPALRVIAAHAPHPVRPTCPDQMFKCVLLGGELPSQGIQIDHGPHATYLVSKRAMRQGDNHSLSLIMNEGKVIEGNFRRA